MPEDNRDKPENPLLNILLNVLLPVVILSYLSNPEKEIFGIPVGLGPFWALIVAISFPVIYGVWFFITRRKTNFFSILGFVSVLLTGVLGLYRVNPTLFALKEAAIPTMFGIAILISHWTSKPLIELFLLNPDVVNLDKINAVVAEKGREEEYGKLKFMGTILLAASMFVSAILNFFLAIYFLHGKEGDEVAYNEALGKIQGYGFLVIGIPFAVIMMFALFYILKKTAALADLEMEELFNERVTTKATQVEKGKPVEKSSTEPS
ncbi:MAG: VC0807 family protein [Verrucomicrobiota bacterium]